VIQDEIVAMMKYLKVEDFTVKSDKLMTGLKGINDFEYHHIWIATFSEKLEITGPCSQRLKQEGTDEESILDEMHTRLVELCREKARRYWANVELANNNLFWCTYEN
jgi:hypothetical protein